MCPIEGPNGATMTRATTIIERGTAARRLVESVDKRRRERADRIDVISATERGGTPHRYRPVGRQGEDLQDRDLPRREGEARLGPL